MDLEPLDSRRIKSDLCSVFRLLFCYPNLENPTLFAFSKRKRGHRYQLAKKFADSILQLSFSHRIINHWNNLPSVVVESSNIGVFRRRLRPLNFSSVYPNA